VTVGLLHHVQTTSYRAQWLTYVGVCNHIVWCNAKGVGDREILETYSNSASKNTSETDIFPHGPKSLLTSVMGLTLRKPENYLTSLMSVWNFNSIQRVCVNPNVSIHKCFKTHRLAQFQTLASKRKLIKHFFPSTQFSFAPLSDIKWNTADGSEDHNATNTATRMFSIRTTLFTIHSTAVMCD